MTKIRKSYPSIKELDLAAFEEEFKVKIPIAYRSFLLEHNGGIPDKIFFVKDDADVVLNEFLPLKYSDLSVESYLNDFHFNLQQLIPVAEDAFGNLILMDCNSEKGILHFWSHETTEITYVTDSFQYFFENLQEELEDDTEGV